MERHQNEGAEETGDPLENSLTNGIFRLRKSVCRSQQDSVCKKQSVGDSLQGSVSRSQSVGVSLFETVCRSQLAGVNCRGQSVEDSLQESCSDDKLAASKSARSSFNSSSRVRADNLLGVAYLTEKNQVGWTPAGAPRPRSRGEGAIRATLTRAPSASSLLRAGRAVFPSDPLLTSVLAAEASCMSSPHPTAPLFSPASFTFGVHDAPPAGAVCITPNLCFICRQVPTTTCDGHRVSGKGSGGAVARALASHHGDPVGLLPHFRMWESCWTMPLAGGFSRGTPISPDLAFQRLSIIGRTLATSQATLLESTMGSYACVASPLLLSSSPFTTRHTRGTVSSLLYCTGHDDKRPITGKEWGVKSGQGSELREIAIGGRPEGWGSKRCGRVFELGVLSHLRSLFQPRLPSSSETSRCIAITCTWRHSADDRSDFSDVTLASSFSSRDLTKYPDEFRQFIARRGYVVLYLNILSNFTFAFKSCHPVFHFVSFAPPHQLFTRTGTSERGDIWAAHKIEVLRADEGEVSTQKCRNARAGETGDPRENPPTGSIVWHDSHVRKRRNGPARNLTPLSRRRETRSLTSTATAAPPTREVWADSFNDFSWQTATPRADRRRFFVSTGGKSRRHGTTDQPDRKITVSPPPQHRKLSPTCPWGVLVDAEARDTVRQLPTHLGVNRVQSPARSPEFCMWESCRTMRLVGEFSRGSPVSPALSFRAFNVVHTLQDLPVSRSSGHPLVQRARVCRASVRAVTSSSATANCCTPSRRAPLAGKVFGQGITGPANLLVGTSPRGAPTRGQTFPSPSLTTSTLPSSPPHEPSPRAFQTCPAQHL
ncbi:hypothetical protein PR048_000694 [Dryococelus australis]|uniref:Uncharacterized protein n=1 Tax=Dryococelus australis TaxID=614101 RepID=A0ABQ9IFD1_9NEOP|nr:hypothetical protein PR048_000694 [Dryococelus australis]